MLVPKLFTTLKDYSRAQFVADATAGVIVGIVALPLAIAFAIASGVTPDRGLWTAIIGGFLISALGGSRVQIGGPTGAFVVIVYGIVQKYGVDGLIVATMMAGVFLIILGAAKLGGIIKFIPHPVVTGFTSGIAVIIFSSQVKDLVGLRMGAVPRTFSRSGARSPSTPRHTMCRRSVWRCSHWRSSLGGSGCIRGSLDHSWRSSSPRFVVPVVSPPGRNDRLTVRRHLASFPHPTIPHITLEHAQQLVRPAFTIALLGAVESLLSAVVADGMIGGRHRSNMELVAQGVANVITPLFGGIPATGAIARTATNVKNGGRTPIAGMTHAVTLMLIVLFFGQWAGRIPLATLAAILVVVAYHMSEWRAFRSELTAPKSDVAVLLATFGLTVLADLTVAIEVGMVLAAFLFMRRMADVTQVKPVDVAVDDEEDGYSSDPNAVSRRTVPKRVEVYEINGPFFFGAAEMFKDTLARVARKPKVLIVRMRYVPAIDSTGMHALKDLVHRSRGDGTLVLISDIHAQPRMALERSAVFEEIGEEHIFDNLDAALAAAREHLDIQAHLAAGNDNPA
jgi:SulP family sulfate permease